MAQVKGYTEHTNMGNVDNYHSTHNKKLSADIAKAIQY